MHQLQRELKLVHKNIIARSTSPTSRIRRAEDTVHGRNRIHPAADRVRERIRTHQEEDTVHGAKKNHQAADKVRAPKLLLP